MTGTLKLCTADKGWLARTKYTKLLEDANWVIEQELEGRCVNKRDLVRNLRDALLLEEEGAEADLVEHKAEIFHQRERFDAYLQELGLPTIYRGEE